MTRLQLYPDGGSHDKPQQERGCESSGENDQLLGVVNGLGHGAKLQRYNVLAM